MEDSAKKKDKELRKGFTTGTCAAAASCAAAVVLLSKGKEVPCEIRIMTPKGIEVRIPVEEIKWKGNWAICSVRKDSGDDPDVTNGALVYGKVELWDGPPGSLRIDGGQGIGRVTKPGLACPVGSAAINPVPRKMIEQEVKKAAQQFGYAGGLAVEISIPQGKALAEKTFNPKLGIVGGISVLGTSGIVEPMSEQALIDTIKVEINVAKAMGTKYLVLTLGNYGEAFLQETKAVKDLVYVKCSNFIGDALTYAKEQGFQGVLLVGHIGKLIKVAAGAMNTHSKYGDKRMETLALHVNRLGGDGQSLLSCVTTEDAVSKIKKEEPSMEKPLWDSVLKAIKDQMEARVGKGLMTEAMIYSNQFGYLGETPGTEAFLAAARKKEEQG